MAETQIVELTQSQRDRLAFIDLRVRFTGEIRRQDLSTRFGIQAAAATRDIAQYKDIAPRNLNYDPRGKVYARGEWFRPVFDFPVERVLTWLGQGFGDGEPLRFKPLVPCEDAAPLNRPDLETLSVLTRAIHRKGVVEIAYRSLSSGLNTREIVPFALADNGLRWHVRAFDRANARFGDFVLTRIAKAKELDGPAAEGELLLADEQWARIVDLEVVPHPGIRWAKAIEADYAMHDGVLRLRTRAALAGYLLRRWSIDCSANHSLDPAAHHLWLRNPQTLYGVESAVFAPGIKEGSGRGPL